MLEDARSVADAMVVLLRRSTRLQLQQDIVERVEGQVDLLAYPVLIGIARLGPVTTARLAGEVDLDRSVVSRRAAALVERGLVQRVDDPTDRRAAPLVLTPAGHRVVELLDRQRTIEIDRALQGWSAADRAALATLLQRFVDALRSPVNPGDGGTEHDSPSP